MEPGPGAGSRQSCVGSGGGSGSSGGGKREALRQAAEFRSGVAGAIAGGAAAALDAFGGSRRVGHPGGGGFDTNPPGDSQSVGSGISRTTSIRQSRRGERVLRRSASESVARCRLSTTFTARISQVIPEMALPCMQS